MDFRLYPLRFELIAHERLTFPAASAANQLRGALGTILRRIVPAPEFARVFQPAAQGDGPSGIADQPRPFVFRARHLDGVAIAPGESFAFGLNLFLMERPVIDDFIQTFRLLASDGLGPERAKAELRNVTGTEPLSIDLRPVSKAPGRIRVDFVTPTELKHEGRVVSEPEFPILFGRIRDRIATLSRLYNGTELAIDYAGSGQRAALVRMTQCSLQKQESRRRSSRTGQTHPLGGFTGYAEYEGELGEFLPFLEAAKWTGVGRQAVWGKGEIEITPLPNW